MKFLVATTLSILVVSDITKNVASQSIIDLAAADGKYGTLLDAVTNTPGVLDAITDNFPVTIFGPTDDAFAAISSTVSGLTTEELATVLAGHVVPGVFTAADVVAAGCVELTTLAKTHVRVMYDGMSVMVNDSTVIQPDILGDGGVIHGIEKVILPGTFHPCPSMSSKKSSKKYSTKKSSSYASTTYYSSSSKSSKRARA
eukprot:scaffold4736_cov105-Cylindrotheca_fusiformis.AAC.9